MAIQRIDALGCAYLTPITAALEVVNQAGAEDLLVVLRDEEGVQVSLSIRREAAHQLVHLIERNLPPRT